MYCLTAWGQRAVDLLQYTASLLGGRGKQNSCNVLPHRLGAVGSGTPAMHLLPGGSGEWDSCNALPYCLGAAGSGSPAIHCLIAFGRGKAKFL